MQRNCILCLLKVSRQNADVGRIYDGSCQVCPDHIDRIDAVTNWHEYVHDYETVSLASLIEKFLHHFKRLFTIRRVITIKLVLMQDRNHSDSGKEVVVNDENLNFLIAPIRSLDQWNHFILTITCLFFFL